MNTQSDNRERRGSTQRMIGEWMAERQQMLIQFCRLAGLEPYTPDKPSKQMLREFCQILVDYTAFGHFEVYDRITRGSERRKQVLQVAEEVYPKLTEATEFIVAFNDRYDTSDHDQPLNHLHDDLSRLGEELAVRIEMEDRLISGLLA